MALGEGGCKEALAEQSATAGRQWKLQDKGHRFREDRRIRTNKVIYRKEAGTTIKPILQISKLSPESARYLPKAAQVVIGVSRT